MIRNLQLLKFSFGDNIWHLTPEAELFFAFHSKTIVHFIKMSEFYPRQKNATLIFGAETLMAFQNILYMYPCIDTFE